MLVLFCQGATAQTGRQGLPSSSGSHAIAYSATVNGYRGFAIDWRFAVTPYLFLPLRTQGESAVVEATVNADLNLRKILGFLNMAFPTGH
ncbi:hypothetical protein [uncultured Microbulbifer sp.]|uniref:hypothetical protein n=1 Tax=uncultured Microbulbifer sp. TaxID=348147 RepID=UPI00260D8048|nr:hypothetical protein [uncultured Microbulbifer sp.]